MNEYENALFIALTELHSLLQAECNNENSYQEFLENNPVVLETLGYKKCLSFDRKSGRKLAQNPELEGTIEPDFIGVKSTNMEVEILEIKTPFVGSLTVDQNGRRAKAKADFSSYISQVNEYISSILECREIAQEVCRYLEIQECHSLSGRLLYGLKSQNNTNKLNRVIKDNTRNDIEVVYFDTLVEMLLKKYEEQVGWRCNRQGISLHLIIKLLDIDSGYVLDWGGEEKSRLSVYLKEKVLFAKVIDESDEEHVIRFNAEAYLEKKIYLRLDFASDTQGNFFSLCINGINKCIKFDNTTSPLRFDFSKGVLGTNFEKDNGAEFNLYEKAIYSNIPDVWDTIQLYHYFMQKHFSEVLTEEKWVSFSKQQYLEIKKTSDANQLLVIE